MSLNGNDDVSDYEKQRLLNIERNKKFLSMLNLDKISVTKPNKTPPPKRKKTSESNDGSGSKKSKKSFTPLRMNLRRRNSRGEIEPLNGEELQILMDEDPQKERENAIDRSGPICINDIFTYGSDIESGTRFIETILEANPLKENFVPSHDSPWEIVIWRKVVPNRVFSMDIHPTLNKTLICAGDKDGDLGFWDVSKDDLNYNASEENEFSLEAKHNSSATFVVSPHTKAISCVMFPRNTPNKLYSTSFDGQFRCIDLESCSTNDKKYFDLIFSSKSMLSDVSFNKSCDGCFLSNNLGEIISLDLRSQEHTIYPVHYKKVTSVSMHPTIDHWVLTASLDGHVKVFDTRMMKLDEESNSYIPVQMVKYSNRIWNATFSPYTGSKIIVNSNENIIEIWSKFPNDTDFGQKPENVIRINHNNQTGKWISSFKPMWNETEDKFIIGNLNRGVEIFNENGECEEFLKHPELTTIPSLNMWKIGGDEIITGTASGVYVWKKGNQKDV